MGFVQVFIYRRAGETTYMFKVVWQNVNRALDFSCNRRVAKYRIEELCSFVHFRESTGELILVFCCTPFNELESHRPHKQNLLFV